VSFKLYHSVAYGVYCYLVLYSHTVLVHYTIGDGDETRADAYMAGYQPVLSKCPWMPIGEYRLQRIYSRTWDCTCVLQRIYIRVYCNGHVQVCTATDIHMSKHSLPCTHCTHCTCTHCTVLILYSYCTHTVLVLYSYCTHTVPILHCTALTALHSLHCTNYTTLTALHPYLCSTHTVRILYAYCTHTVLHSYCAALILCCTHTVLRSYCAALTLHSHCTHTALILHS
jgi:hypothetical protein